MKVMKNILKNVEYMIKKVNSFVKIVKNIYVIVAN